MVITCRKNRKKIHQQFPHGLQKGHQTAWFVFLYSLGCCRRAPSKGLANSKEGQLSGILRQELDSTDYTESILGREKAQV